jgi:uncharacterized cupredoxin-like copper-binding protein
MKRLTAIVVILVFASLLVSCAAGASGSSPSTTLKVDMSEFVFTPTEYAVPAGETITVKLENSGDIEHDFIILKKGIEVKGKFDHEKQMNDILFHAMLDAGKSGEFTFIAPNEPGEYQIVCGILGHFQAGMIGKLTVVAK